MATKWSEYSTTRAAVMTRECGDCAGGLHPHRPRQGRQRPPRGQPYALPVAAPAIAQLTGVNVSTLLINVAIIEYAYSIPGLFRLINTAVRAPADIPVLQAMVIEG